VFARTTTAGATVCVDLQNNASTGATSSYTLGQTAGVFNFAMWNSMFALTPNLMARGNTFVGPVVPVGAITLGVCTAPTTVTPL
jgi:hypothetical protein